MSEPEEQERLAMIGRIALSIFELKQDLSAVEFREKAEEKLKRVIPDYEIQSRLGRLWYTWR